MKIERWGLIDYQLAVDRQLALLEDVAEGAEQTIVICSHPAVVTLGRGTQPEDLSSWQGAVVEASRGGRATYHGPNQIIIYPIIDLRRPHRGFPERDVHSYLRALEKASVRALHGLGVQAAEARTVETEGLSLTGVWVGQNKVASIGIAVRKWVTYHGVAINLEDDPSAFQGIRPCGFSRQVMSSVERELGRAVRREDCLPVFEQAFIEEFA